MSIKFAYKVGLFASGLICRIKKNISEKGGPIREWAYPLVGLSSEFYGIAKTC